MEEESLKDSTKSVLSSLCWFHTGDVARTSNSGAVSVHAYPVPSMCLTRDPLPQTLKSFRQIVTVVSVLIEEL